MFKTIHDTEGQMLGSFQVFPSFPGTTFSKHPSANTFGVPCETNDRTRRQPAGLDESNYKLFRRGQQKRPPLERPWCLLESPRHPLEPLYSPMT